MLSYLISSSTLNVRVHPFIVYFIDKNSQKTYLKDIKINKCRYTIITGKQKGNHAGYPTFNEHHTSVNENMASFTCIKKLNISAYIFKAAGVKIIHSGQSTW